MIIDLTKFMCIWLVILIMFTCVSMLLFGSLHFFHSFYDVIIFFFQSGIGSWSMDVFVGQNEKGD